MATDLIAINRVGAVILLRRDGAALLQHRDNKPGLRDAGMWVPPGGHAEPEESILECARRELREETEYLASDLRSLITLDCVAENWPAYRLTIFWDWYDDAQPLVCHEGQALAFVERALATNYPIPPQLLNAWDAALEAAGSTESMGV